MNTISKATNTLVNFITESNIDEKNVAIAIAAAWALDCFKDIVHDVLEQKGNLKISMGTFSISVNEPISSEN